MFTAQWVLYSPEIVYQMILRLFYRQWGFECRTLGLLETKKPSPTYEAVIMWLVITLSDITQIIQHMFIWDASDISVEYICSHLCVIVRELTHQSAEPVPTLRLLSSSTGPHSMRPLCSGRLIYCHGRGQRIRLSADNMELSRFRS